MKKVTRTSAGSVSIDTDTLERVRADFEKNGKARVQVGVLNGGLRNSVGHAVPVWAGNHWKVENDPPAQTNAEVAAKNEFGSISDNIPARSFLRMPVITELPGALAKTDRQLWHKIIIQQGIRGALGLLGAYALDVIHLAFETNGFGSWIANMPLTIKLKKSSRPLIDSAQLRQSITAELVDAKQ